MSDDNQACPECGGTGFKTHYRLKGEFNTVKCKACGFVFMCPYPSDEFLHAHYKVQPLYGQFSARRSDYDRAVSDRADLIRLCRRVEPEFTFAGRALDFGAGVGIAVAALEGLGFEAAGIDSNPQSPEAGRRLFDVEISDTDLGAVEGNLRVFSIFEVLEHIKYPRSFMRAVRDKLAVGGFVVGSVPNYDGLARYLKGGKSIATYYPEHINQFTPASLRRTLEGAGFEVGYIGFPPPYGVVVTVNFRHWLLRRFGGWAGTRGLIEVISFVKKHLIYPLPNLFAQKTGLLGHGIVFVARKVA